MAKICGKRGKMEDGRVGVCRRIPNHLGDHRLTSLSSSHAREQRATFIKLTRHSNAPATKLSLAALVSDLNHWLPEGDYTEMVSRVYINGRVIMIEFKPRTIQELVKGRKKVDG